MTMRFGVGLCAAVLILLWPVIGTTSVPLLTLVLAALVAASGTTVFTVCVGIGLTVGTEFLYGLTLGEFTLPWLIVCCAVAVMASWIVWTPGGLPKSFGVFLVSFVLLQFLTATFDSLFVSGYFGTRMLMVFMSLKL